MRRSYPSDSAMSRAAYPDFLAVWKELSWVNCTRYQTNGGPDPDTSHVELKRNEAHNGFGRMLSLRRMSKVPNAWQTGRVLLSEQHARNS